MKTTRIPFFFGSVIVILSIVSFAYPEQCVLVDSLKGTAEVQRAGRQQWQKAAQAMKLYNNDIIRVLPQGYASLQWPDGSVSYMHGNSQILINLASEETGRKKFINHATVFFGAVFFVIKKIAPRGLFDDSSMRIYTPTAVLAIRGTAFEVLVDGKTGTTAVKVVGGTVQVRNILKNVSLFLTSPYQTKVVMNNDPAAPQAVPASEVDSLKKWVPASAISEALEKQVAQEKKNYYLATGKLEKKCIVVLLSNQSSYHGPWSVAAEITKYLVDRLRNTNPDISFVVRDSLNSNDLFALCRQDSARFVLAGTIEAFDLAQHAEISARADEYREYAIASVTLRLKLLDAAAENQIAEEIYSGESINRNAAGNSWQKLGSLKFDLNDKPFASSILGLALAQAIGQAVEKMSRYIE